MEDDYSLEDSPLGKPAGIAGEYTASLLCPLSREASRAKLQLTAEELPFSGVDCWNLYEVSWLDPQGKPQVAMGRLDVPCESPRLVESKSLKLYLNSFNQASFESRERVAQIIEADLSACLGASVAVQLFPLAAATFVTATSPQGESLDQLEITTTQYQPDPGLLTLAAGSTVVEHLYTDLFRSCCPVTGQPDWASVSIAYRGLPIDHQGLLSYLVSFRQHSGFHEHCVEQVYVDIQRRCRPESLTVSAQFLRRGGIDINPIRSSDSRWPELERLVRQ